MLAAIIKDLNLRKPIYRKTAAYGHFGRDDIEFPWEKLNKVEEIMKYIDVKKKSTEICRAYCEINYQCC